MGGEERGEWIYALLAGLGIGFLLGKLVDPEGGELGPEREALVEAIAKSHWAREWAEKFCAGPPEVKEECVEKLSRELAKRLVRAWGLA